MPQIYFNNFSGREKLKKRSCERSLCYTHTHTETQERAIPPQLVSLFHSVGRGNTFYGSFYTIVNTQSRSGHLSANNIPFRKIMGRYCLTSGSRTTITKSRAAWEILNK